MYIHIYIYVHIFMDLDRRIRHLDLGQACASDMLAIQHSKGVCYLSLHSEQCAPCIRRSQGNRELPVWRGCAFRGTGCTGRLCWSDVHFFVGEWFHGFSCWFQLHVPACAENCTILPNTIRYPPAEPRILQWPCKGLANGLGTFTRRRFAKSNHLCLAGSLNTYDHYRIPITIWWVPTVYLTQCYHECIPVSRIVGVRRARWPSNESGPTMRFNERSLSTIWLLCIDVEKRLRFFNHTNQKDPEKAKSEQGKVKHTSPCQDPRGFPPAV